MYEEQFRILENLLGRSSEQEVWSVYSLCNHNSKFENLEECREILKLFVKYLADEKKDLREEVELIYLVMGNVSSDEITHKLVFESDILSGGGLREEVGQSSLYGIVSRRSRGELVVVDDCMLNSSQFYVECEDVYKSIMAKNMLSSSLWSSKFSNIDNTESHIYRESYVAGSDPGSGSLDKSEEKCKTEPYPVLFTSTKSSQDSRSLCISDSKDTKDGVTNDAFFSGGGNNTDPCPRKCVSKTEKRMVDFMDKGEEDIKYGETETAEKVSRMVVDEEMNLFSDKDVERDAGGSAKAEVEKAKLVKRRKTTKSRDGCVGGADNERKVDFDPLEVEPIMHSKVKREKMYKDMKTGYLVVEDDVDFVMEKENKSSKQTETTARAGDSVGDKKAGKGKKSQTLSSSATSCTSKQQTLTSFFKIVKPATNKGT